MSKSNKNEKIVKDKTELECESAVETPEEPKLETKLAEVYNCNRLNIRKEPFLNSEVLTIIDKGHAVTVYTRNNVDKFYKVWTTNPDTGEEIEGYAMSDYLKVM